MERFPLFEQDLHKAIHSYTLDTFKIRMLLMDFLLSKLQELHKEMHNIYCTFREDW